MKNSFCLFVIIFSCISINSTSIETTTETNEEVRGDIVSTSPCPQIVIDGILLKKSVIYAWAIFTVVIFLVAVSMLVMWIKDTTEMSEKIRELEKRVQDAEQYGVYKPIYNPQYVKSLPKPEEEKRTQMNTVNEKTGTTTTKTKTTTTLTPKPTVSIVKGTEKEKKKQSVKKSEKQASRSITQNTESEQTRSTVTDGSGRTVTEGDTLDESKRPVVSNRRSVVSVRKETEEGSVATAEVQLASRRAY